MSLEDGDLVESCGMNCTWRREKDNREGNQQVLKGNTRQSFLKRLVHSS